MTRLDIPTLALLLGLVNITLAGVMVYFSLARRTYAGFHFWTFGMVIGGLGTALIGLRHVIPDFFTIVLANVFLVVLVLLVARGLSVFFDHPPWTRAEVLLVAATAVALAYFTYSDRNVAVRIEVVSSAMMLSYMRALYLILRYGSGTLGGRSPLLTVSLGTGILWALIRIVMTPMTEAHVTDFMAAGIISSLSFAIVIFINLVLVAGLVAMNFQRLEKDMAQADQEIRTLSGLLPICANCHKIRDDKGYWEGVDTYLRQHGAQLTHSICPECVRKLYPELKLDDLK